MKKIKIKIGLITLMLAVGTFAASPNIVMILADDLGRMDTAVFGAPHYLTPNIDKLAAEGMRLTDFHANSPNCAPSRAALYTGQCAPRTGVYNVAGSERGKEIHRTLFCPENLQSLALCKPLFAESLQQAGYRTGLFGKWHLGDFGDYHPSKRGYDEAVILEKPTANGHYGFVTLPPVEHPKGQYLGDFLTNQAEQFIDKHSKDPRPFYLQLNHFLVHAPLEAPQDVVERFKKELAGVEGVDPTYAAMIWCLDQSVGRVMAALERNGVADNTLVIFTSDNGGVGGYANAGVKGNAHEITSNLPFKGGKTQLYEGGTRVPFIACWPGVVPAGSVSDTPAMMVDLYPTVLAAAGVAVPTMNKPATDANSIALGSPTTFQLDGTSLLPHLCSGGKTPVPARDLFWCFPAYCAAPEGDTRLDWRSTPQSTILGADGFKFTEYYHDGNEELYDMNKDPYEQVNLVASMPEKAAELRKRLHQWQHDTDARVPIRKDGDRIAMLDAPGQAVQTGLEGVEINAAHARLLYYTGDSGLYVTGAPKSGVGIRAGWLLLDLNGIPLQTFADFHHAMSTVKAGDDVKVRYWVNGKIKVTRLETNPTKGNADRKKIKKTKEADDAEE